MALADGDGRGFAFLAIGFQDEWDGVAFGGVLRDENVDLAEADEAWR